MSVCPLWFDDPRPPISHLILSSLRVCFPGLVHRLRMVHTVDSIIPTCERFKLASLGSSDADEATLRKVWRALASKIKTLVHSGKVRVCLRFPFVEVELLLLLLDLIGLVVEVCV